MTALIVLGCIALFILLICLIPVGIDAAYNSGGFALGLRIWRITLKLGGKKKDRPEKKRKNEKKDGEERKKRKLPDLSILKSLAKRGYRMLCRIVSRLRVDILKIHFVSAFEDPSVTAMAYAAAGTAMDGLLQLGGKRIRHPDLLAETDFQSDQFRLDMRIVFTWRIGGLLGAALGFGFGFLRDFISYKREVAKNGKSNRRHDGRRDGKDPHHGGFKYRGGRAHHDA